MVVAETGICSVHVKALSDYIEFKFSYTERINIVMN
jgi:hypothetical protein